MVTASSSSMSSYRGLPSSASYASSTTEPSSASSHASTVTLTSSPAVSAMVVAGEIGDGDSDFDDVEEDWRTRMVEGRDLSELTSKEQAVQNVINGENLFHVTF